MADRIDWKMIDIERRLMGAQCIDGKSGLSEFEMALASGAVPDARGLHLRYRAKFGDGAGIRRDLPAQFAYAAVNLEAALRSIVRSAPIPNAGIAEVRSLGRVEVLPRSPSATFFLGAYSVTTKASLLPPNMARFQAHLLRQFWKNGVRFAPHEVVAKAQVSGAWPYRDLSITIVFPVRSCSLSPAKPASPRLRRGKNNPR